MLDLHTVSTYVTFFLTLVGDTKYRIHLRQCTSKCTNTKIVQSEFLSTKGALRVGLIAYRDHPPQDHVYIVKNCTYGHD